MGEFVMALFDNNSFKLLEQGLSFTNYKMKVINQNIANDSTPGYKARTAEFKLVLKEKCKCRYHIGDPQNPNDDNPYELVTHTYTEPNTNQTLDENNVDMEKEQTALADAQYQFQALADKATAEFAMYRTALSK